MLLLFKRYLNVVTTDCILKKMEEKFSILPCVSVLTYSVCKVHFMGVIELNPS